jgi:hypothetical protein
MVASAGAEGAAAWRSECEKEVEEALMVMVFPLSSKPAYFAPTRKYRFVLTAQEMEALHNEFAVRRVCVLLCAAWLAVRPPVVT